MPSCFITEIFSSVWLIRPMATPTPVGNSAYFDESWGAAAERDCVANRKEEEEQQEGGEKNGKNDLGIFFPAASMIAAGPAVLAVVDEGPEGEERGDGSWEEEEEEEGAGEWQQKQTQQQLLQEPQELQELQKEEEEERGEAEGEEAAARAEGAQPYTFLPGVRGLEGTTAAASEERETRGEASEASAQRSCAVIVSHNNGGGAQIAGEGGGRGEGEGEGEGGGGGKEGGLLATESAEEVSGRPGSGASAASATPSVKSLVRDSVESTLARAMAEALEVDMMASSPTGRCARK